MTKANEKTTTTATATKATATATKATTKATATEATTTNNKIIAEISLFDKKKNGERKNLSFLVPLNVIDKVAWKKEAENIIFSLEYDKAQDEIDRLDKEITDYQNKENPDGREIENDNQLQEYIERKNSLVAESSEYYDEMGPIHEKIEIDFDDIDVFMYSILFCAGYSLPEKISVYFTNNKKIEKAIEKLVEYVNNETLTKTDGQETSLASLKKSIVEYAREFVSYANGKPETYNKRTLERIKNEYMLPIVTTCGNTSKWGTSGSTVKKITAKSIKRSSIAKQFLVAAYASKGISMNATKTVKIG